MSAYDDTYVISGGVRLEDLSESGLEGALGEIVDELIHRDSTDEPEATFQNMI